MEYLATSTFLAIAEYEGGVGPDGYLSSDARNAFARAVRSNC